jgi:hypothetical protein
MISPVPGMKRFVDAADQITEKVASHPVVPKRIVVAKWPDPKKFNSQPLDLVLVTVLPPSPRRNGAPRQPVCGPHAAFTHCLQVRLPRVKIFEATSAFARAAAR